MIATSFALLAFAAAVLVGMAAGNELPVIVWRAVTVLAVCWLVGRIVGTIAQHTVEQHIAQYKQDHPIPEELTLEQLLERKQAQARAQAQAQNTSNTSDNSQAQLAQPQRAANAA